MTASHEHYTNEPCKTDPLMDTDARLLHTRYFSPDHRLKSLPLKARRITAGSINGDKLSLHVAGKIHGLSL